MWRLWFTSQHFLVALKWCAESSISLCNFLANLWCSPSWVFLDLMGTFPYSTKAWCHASEPLSSPFLTIFEGWESISVSETGATLALLFLTLEGKSQGNYFSSDNNVHSYVLRKCLFWKWLISRPSPWMKRQKTFPGVCSSETQATGCRVRSHTEESVDWSSRPSSALTCFVEPHLM
jgi:hypothetical protein